MKLHAALGLLALMGCATAPSSRPTATAALAATGGSGSESREWSEPVRLETRAGSFLVHPNNAEDFARLLAGEPTQHQYYSGADVP